MPCSLKKHNRIYFLILFQRSRSKKKRRARDASSSGWNTTSRCRNWKSLWVQKTTTTLMAWTLLVLLLNNAFSDHRVRRVASHWLVNWTYGSLRENVFAAGQKAQVRNESAQEKPQPQVRPDLHLQEHPLRVSRLPLSLPVSLFPVWLQLWTGSAELKRRSRPAENSSARASSFDTFEVTTPFNAILMSHESCDILM